MPRRTDETEFLLTAKDRTRRAFTSARRGIAGVKGSVTGLHTAFIALAGIGGAGLLTKGLIDVNAEMQTIKSSLKTVTGSTEAAALAFSKIEQFATKTPFDLQQVTGAFIKLKAFGLDPSADALTAYGNIASGMGKSLDQMIEAVADAATGEFERLKEFGIKARKQGDDVSFIFRGVTTTIKNDSAEITRYLQNIGNVEFGGAMSDQMKNLAPAFSNFGTAIDMLFVKIGEAGVNDAVSGLTNDMTAFIESLDDAKIAEFTHNALDSFAGFLRDIDDITTGIGRFIALMNSIGPAAIKNPGIPGGLADYQLGDFNNGVNRAPGRLTNYSKPQGRFGSFEEWAAAHGVERKQVDETNNILRDIADKVSNGTPAVAG